MMKNILAFGDSNTWGLIPGTHERYPWEKRWTSILQKKERCRNTHIIEEGLCGRTTIFEDALLNGRNGLDILSALLKIQIPLAAAIIMLGTNDCKTLYGATAYVIGKGIALCLDELIKELPAYRILLVSPILLGENVWKQEKAPEFVPTSVLVCKQLKEEYRKIASIKGNVFIAASDYAAASSIDDEHLTEEGHAVLADILYKKLIDMGVIWYISPIYYDTMCSCSSNIIMYRCLSIF